MTRRENSSLFGQPIPIRSPDHGVAHEPEMLVVLIIRNDEDDIRLLARGGINRRPRLADEDKDTNRPEKVTGIHVNTSWCLLGFDLLPLLIGKETNQVA